MGRWIEHVIPTPPRGMVGFSGTGFRQFKDQLLRMGMEFFGLYYSTYRAIVVSTDDPESDGQPDPQGRIKVRVPAVGDTEDHARLAYPIFGWGSSGNVLKSIPAVGDMVYVEFEFGNLDMPLWKGGWLARGDMPESLKSVKSHGWVTPSGHEIVFGEDEGSEAVRLKHANGAVLTMDRDGNISILNVDAKKVTVGKGDTDPAVLGAKWKSLIERLIDAINQLTVPTAVGPSGTPINAPVFAQIKAELQQALSTTVDVAH